MPFQIFMGWLFDGNPNSPIPEPDPDNGIIDILKYNSPITHTYIISLFMKCGSFNYYLNEHFNNINLRYIDKSELFYFIKKQVYERNIKRYQLYYIKRTRKSKLFDIIRERMLYLKNDDISLICDRIDSSEEKEKIYTSLGIEKPKRERVKNKKIKNIISLNEFLSENFNIMEI